jgi:hypothetical protein
MAKKPVKKPVKKAGDKLMPNRKTPTRRTPR